MSSARIIAVIMLGVQGCASTPTVTRNDSDLDATVERCSSEASQKMEDMDEVVQSGAGVAWKIGSYVTLVVSFILTLGTRPIVDIRPKDRSEWYHHFYRDCMRKAGFAF